MTRDFAAERARLECSLAKQSPATRLHLAGKFRAVEPEAPAQREEPRDFQAEQERLQRSLSRQHPATRLHLAGKFKIED
jgi:hypothetical protein